MRLKTPLKVELDDGEKWILAEEFTAYSEKIGKGRVYFTVPAGFKTDFASVPKVFLSFLRWRDKFNKASVIHDWLYNTKILSRKEADRVYLELMLVLGIEKWKAYLFYIAVRLFGFFRWRR
ncbi:DUF1353 domain-containing protein [Persephonella sp.]